jgi:hypothetical protein
MLIFELPKVRTKSYRHPACQVLSLQTRRWLDLQQAAVQIDANPMPVHGDLSELRLQLTDTGDNVWMVLPGPVRCSRAQAVTLCVPRCVLNARRA